MDLLGADDKLDAEDTLLDHLAVLFFCCFNLFVGASLDRLLESRDL